MLIAFMHRLPRWLVTTFIVIAGLALAVGSALAQGRPYGFVYLMGGDTVGVERVTPLGTTMMGDIRMRGQGRLEWRATLPSPGQVSSVTILAYREAKADAPLVQRAVLRLVGDSAVAEITGPTGASSTQRFKTSANAFMLVNASAGMIDIALMRARLTPGAVDTIPVFLTTGGQTVPSILTTSTDSATWSLGGQVSQLKLTNGRLREAFVAAQNFRMVRVEGAALDGLALAAPDYSAPAGAPYRAERVTVPGRDGHTLVGTLTTPQGASERLPVVVTISGSGPQDRDEYIPIVPGFRPFRQLADTLGRHGIAVLRLDDRGTGESGGSFAGSTSADFANDVRDAVRWLRARPGIDPSRVFLLGHSEGGLIAPMVAADDPQLAGIVVLAGPSRNGLDIVKFQQRYAIEQDTNYAAPARRDSALRAAAAAVEQLGRSDKWMGYFFSYDPIPAAKRVKVPVLIAHGGTDQQVTAEQAEQLGAAMRSGGNTNVTVTVFPGLNHLFLPDATGNPANYTSIKDGHIGANVMGPILDWLLAHARR